MAIINGVELTAAQDHFLRSLLADMRRKNDVLTNEWNVHKSTVLNHIVDLEEILDGVYEAKGRG